MLLAPEANVEPEPGRDRAQSDRRCDVRSELSRGALLRTVLLREALRPLRLKKGLSLRLCRALQADGMPVKFAGEHGYGHHEHVQKDDAQSQQRRRGWRVGQNFAMCRSFARAERT